MSTLERDSALGLRISTVHTAVVQSPERDTPEALRTTAPALGADGES